MKPFSMARVAAAIAMLALVVMVSVLGVACDVRCARPASAHACCPILSSSSRPAATIVGLASCQHLSNILPADLVPPASIDSGLEAFTPVEAAVNSAASEIDAVPVTASPPKFNLRI